ncbi:MTH1187 family thiamine-binding protein [Desulfurococcus amylolyticus]|uniref:MTH1187 family thiamine-binding protein n=1 Tax=Desulfurococcus amylolyticus TaxID=94694 RepID=UPI001F3E85AE|nr:MTH1187 family thiamine-binding protein [Desulfurococcus amylolyticus]
MNVRYLLTLRVIPIGTCSTSLSSYVAEVEKVLSSLGLKHVLTASATIIELSDLGEVSKILESVVDELVARGVKRVSIDLSIDYRVDKELSIEGKVRSVEEKLGKG